MNPHAPYEALNLSHRDMVAGGGDLPVSHDDLQMISRMGGATSMAFLPMATEPGKYHSKYSVPVLIGCQ